MPDDQVQIGLDKVAEQACVALERASGNVAEAAKLLEAEVRKSRSLRQALLEPLIQYACHQAVAFQSRRARDRSWSPTNIRPGMSDADRVKLLAAGTLLMFPLPGGQKLSEATRDQIQEAAEFYGKQSADMSHKARWLRLIAQSVPADKKAGDVLDEARLRELQEEARADG